MPPPPGWDDDAIRLPSFAEMRRDLREHLWTEHRIDAATTETRLALDEIHREAHEREGPC